MRQERVIKKSKKACENVASKICQMEESPSPLEIKKMVEEELGFGLTDEEIAILAVAFKHIDNLFEMHKENVEVTRSMIYG